MDTKDGASLADVISHLDEFDLQTFATSGLTITTSTALTSCAQSRTSKSLRRSTENMSSIRFEADNTLTHSSTESIPRTRSTTSIPSPASTHTSVSIHVAKSRSRPCIQTVDWRTVKASVPTSVISAQPQNIADESVVQQPSAQPNSRRRRASTSNIRVDVIIENEEHSSSGGRYRYEKERSISSFTTADVLYSELDNEGGLQNNHAMRDYGFDVLARHDRDNVIGAYQALKDSGLHAEDLHDLRNEKRLQSYVRVLRFDECLNQEVKNLLKWFAESEELHEFFTNTKARDAIIDGEASVKSVEPKTPGSQLLQLLHMPNSDHDSKYAANFVVDLRNRLKELEQEEDMLRKSEAANSFDEHDWSTGLVAEAGTW